MLSATEAKLGRANAQTIRSLQAVGANLGMQGRLREGELMFRSAVERLIESKKGNSPLEIELYRALATNLHWQRRYAEARAMALRQLLLSLDVYGEKHRTTASAYEQLGDMHYYQRRHAEAQRLYERALAIVKQLDASGGLFTASLNASLADNLFHLGETDRAISQVRDTLAVYQRELGKDHNNTGLGHYNLGIRLLDTKKYSEAKVHFAAALNIWERNSSGGPVWGALGGLGDCHLHNGRIPEAVDYYRRSLAAKHIGSERRAKNSGGLFNLGLALFCNRDFAEAEQHLTAAVDAFERSRLSSAFSSLERSVASGASPAQLLAMLLARRSEPDLAWSRFEQSLARGLMDELRIRQQRLLTEDEAARMQRLKAELDGTEALDQQLSQLREGTDEPPARLEEVTRKKVRLQLEIAEVHKQAAKRHDEQLSGTAYDLNRIQPHLPADSALVAWLDEQIGTLTEHWAVVVRNQGAPTWIRLNGSAADGAWTEREAELGNTVAALIANRPGPRDSENIGSLIRELSARRITPLLPALAATKDLPEVRHLIVLPSASLNGVPIELLVHRYTVSYAPSATVLAWLAERRSGRDGDERMESRGGSELRPQTLLAVGDPIFASEEDAKSGMLLAERNHAARVKEGTVATVRQRILRSVVRGDGQFSPLPGARQELATIAKAFRQRHGSVTLLTGAEATEARLRQFAESQQLVDYRYVHFATHAVVDMRQAFRSALILSTDFQTQPNIKDLEAMEYTDGRLSAEEIMRSWDLNADLVVLSACQTGLGKYVSGEGHIGFAQALLLAGARSVLLSLWKVDDAASTLLMTRFYRNLLASRLDRTKPASKAEALSQAKEWLRQLTPDDVALELQRLAVDSDAERGTKTRRQSAPIPADTTSEAKSLKPYKHPFFWAGFVLIGDPN